MGKRLAAVVAIKLPGDSIVTAAELAQWLMVNVSRIHQMGREGVVQRLEDGKYKLSAGVQGYINFLRGASDDDDLISLSREKAKLTKAQRLRAELDLEVARDKYITVAEVEAEFASFAKSVVGILDTLPDRMERDADLLPAQFLLIENTINSLREEIYQKLTEPEPEPPEPEPESESEPDIEVELATEVDDSV